MLSSFSFDPSTALLSADLLSIWKQSAMLTILTEGKKEEDTESTLMSEQDREILRTERKRKHSSMREVGHLFAQLEIRAKSTF